MHAKQCLHCNGSKFESEFHLLSTYMKEEAQYHERPFEGVSHGDLECVSLAKWKKKKNCQWLLDNSGQDAESITTTSA